MQTGSMNKKVCHCAHCPVENFCAANNWLLSDEYDPCCPNMKQFRKQLQQEKEQWKQDQKLYY